MAKEAIEIVIGIKDARVSEGGEFYTIPITIYNNTTNMGFRMADVAVKNNATNDVQEAHFGRIEPRRSDVRTVNLRGGVDWCAYNIFPDVGDKIFGAGAGNNAPAVNIRISD